jgi:hypothetical protein
MMDSQQAYRLAADIILAADAFAVPGKLKIWRPRFVDLPLRVL